VVERLLHTQEVAGSNPASRIRFFPRKVDSLTAGAAKTRSRRTIVKQSGITQAQLASVLGVEQGTVSKIMTGARSITVDPAKRIAKHFKVKASALLEV
jgi:DNA-binding XRE family transcriptional regulator